MSANFKQKEIEKIKEILATYEEEAKTLTKKIEDINEKYRKLAEAEKETLVSDLNNLYQRSDMWKKMLTEINDEEISNPVETPVAEEKVVDTLFPENNEDEKISEDEQKESADSEVTEDEGPEYDGAGFTFADNEAHAKEDDSDEKADESETVDDDEWPETIKEW